MRSAPIRACVLTGHDGSEKWMNGIGTQSSVLAESGIDVTAHFSRADVVFFVWSKPQKQFANLPSETRARLYNETRPVFLFECKDEAYCFFRDFGRFRNLKAIFKNYILDPLELNNGLVADLGTVDEPQSWNWRSFALADLAPSSTRIRDERIPPDHLPLIHAQVFDFLASFLAPGHGMQLRRRLESNGIDDWRKRPIDVFCTHRPKPGILGELRNKARSMVEAMPGVRSHTQRLARDDYLTTLLSSKIAIGAWGWGEFINLDAYAMYSGALLIKPRCDYIRSHPDLFLDGSTYVACRPDYQDLEEKIRDVLANYDRYLPMLQRNAEMLLSVTPEILAQRLATTVKKLCDCDS